MAYQHHSTPALGVECAIYIETMIGIYYTGVWFTYSMRKPMSMETRAKAHDAPWVHSTVWDGFRAIPYRVISPFFSLRYFKDFVEKLLEIVHTFTHISF